MKNLVFGIFLKQIYIFSIQSISLIRCNFVLRPEPVSPNENLIGLTDNGENVVTYNGITIDKHALPGDYDACKEVLSRFALDANGKSGRL